LESFDLQPGVIMRFKYKINEGNENEISLEVFTDPWNNRYLYCSETQSTAFFVNDGTMFYFTSFHGDRKSLLYFFYITFYKVLLGYYENITIDDLFPLHIIAKNKVSLWIHDLVAPFRQYIKAHYSMRPVWSDSSVNPTRMRLSSSVHMSYFSSRRQEGSGDVLLSGNQISEFSFESAKNRIWAQRVNI
jgi:hypothetical protein